MKKTRRYWVSTIALSLTRDRDVVPRQVELVLSSEYETVEERLAEMTDTFALFAAELDVRSDGLVDEQRVLDAARHLQAKATRVDEAERERVRLQREMTDMRRLYERVLDARCKATDRVDQLADLVRRAQPAIKLFGGAPAPDWLADATAALAELEGDGPTSEEKGS